MSGYNYDTAISYIDAYRTRLEETIEGVEKNFNDMDFVNAVEREKMSECVNNIVSYCNSLLSELDYISLKQ